MLTATAEYNGLPSGMIPKFSCSKWRHMHSASAHLFTSATLPLSLVGVPAAEFAYLRFLERVSPGRLKGGINWPG